MKFSDSLWQHIYPIYDSIVHHPFNQELMNGTLDRERFLFYMKQDVYYLVRFARALAFIAGRIDSVDLSQMFLQFALDTFMAERELGTLFLSPEYHLNHIEPSPACVGYTQHLLMTAATASVEEAIASVLSCCWIYREIGRYMSMRVFDNHPYALWITMCSGKEFSEKTDAIIALVDQMASQSSPEMAARMKRAFELCSLFERDFWDDAYNMVIDKERLMNVVSFS